MGLPVLEGFNQLLGDRIAGAASQLHVIVLILLLACWLWPILAAVLRRLPKSEPDIEWVQLWRCPRCSTFNRRTFIICTHCEYHLKLGGLAKWIPLKFAENVKGAGRNLRGAYILLGWLVYYSLTGLTFWKLRFYSFQQDPLPELTASITMGFLLAALMFFRRALRPQLKSLLGTVMDVIAGMAASTLTLVFLLLWMASFSWPDKPLAGLQFLTNGQLELRRADGRTDRYSPVLNAGQFQIHYTVVNWSLFGVRYVSLARVAGKPLKPKWVLSLVEAVAPFFQQDSNFRPRLARLSQTLQSSPGASYVLYELKPSAELVLRKKS
jgi:hypothetical protein